MPSIPVNDDGAVLYYEDSGVPPNLATASYTTLVILHGGFFNCGIFRRMMPFAPTHNVRIVLLDARDNGQSTPYTDAELDEIHSIDIDIQRNFLRWSIREFATFLETFIREGTIPPIRETRTGERLGGISLIGWSGANGWFIPFFGMAETLPESTRSAINPYLRSYVIYDAPFYTIGMPPPPISEVYCPLRDPKLTEEERVSAFPAWVSGYYSNHSTTVRAALTATSLNILPSRHEFWEGIQRHCDTDLETSESLLSPTLARIPKETLDEIASNEVLVRSTLPVVTGFHREIYAECTENLVFDEAWQTFFPNASINVVSCMKSQGDCLSTTYTFKEMVLKRQAKGLNGRKIDIVLFDEANHLPHWDDPERTVIMFAKMA
ncbi:hypothetical protein BXZ70DRAFT_327424 [Cristinia sonorae]|uniref:AB hydrolase-1 domain-containing protein n=1 Tax=Cristinia sonorae TaxID=1940300 RepID=A0A8K0UM89_9AGAR|nr:hypothetical protein BXZ70DRAFT_327424 [Cristinia sonorae]